MDKSRYIRQTLLPDIGEQGQEKLSRATVAVVGCGGLGSIVAPYLAGAGVGRLILIDGDTVDETNLHRQVFYHSLSVGEAKATVLYDHISELNPEIEIEVVNEFISKSNIQNILSQCDVVVEGTDHMQTKYLVNDYCHVANIPVVYGAIYKYDGYVSFFENKNESSIHLRDIFPEPNEDIPSCSEVGVLGTVAGLIGLLQANEVLKYIANIGKPLIGELLTYNILEAHQMKLKLKKSFVSDMRTVYENTAYDMSKICDVIDISISEILDDREEYHLISILENHEHVALDSKVEHTPLSAWNINNWSPPSDKKIVMYCLSGKRSSYVVEQLNKLHPQSTILSLEGGVRAAMPHVKTSS